MSTTITMRRIFPELECVRLVKDHLATHLEAGDIGTIVTVYNEGEAYEVEFTNAANPYGGLLLTLQPESIQELLPLTS